MGKKFLYYCSNNKVVTKLDEEENKSELLTRLLTDYYNKDLAFLENEQQTLTEKLVINKMQIKNITEKREQVRKLDKEKLKKENEILEIKELAHAVLGKWRNKEITEKEYWSLFKGGKLNIKKARKLLNGKNQYYKK